MRKRGSSESGNSFRKFRFQTDPLPTIQRKLSMTEQTLEILEKAAEMATTEERRVSPMQIAALLIEDATQGLAKQMNGN